LGLLGINLLESCESLVQRHELLRTLDAGNLVGRQADAAPIASLLGRLLLPCMFDQYPPHRLGRSPEEMPPAVPLLSLINIHQTQIRLMHQRRRLQRLSGLLVCQPCRRQFP
jgi:hypothetical protein